MSQSVTGRLEQLAIRDLRLDWENPRLPPQMQSPAISQTELAVYINKHYDPLRIAESIATHEFFQSEPLIAVRDGAAFRVIEGNRRLTALMGLSNEDLREVFAQENKGWRSVPTSYPETVPVLIVEDVQSVAPLLGYRHISGIEPWDPYAQARYIARLVEQTNDLDVVAELVGREVSEVRAMYRDHEILEQADQMFKIDTTRARAAFGVFTNAMGRRGIQLFIGAPQPRYAKTDEWPIPETRKTELRELLHWVFGGPRGDGRLISDSRQLGDLARVLLSSAATAVLRDTNSLVDAQEALIDPREQMERSASRILRDLQRMLDSSVSLPAPELNHFVDAASALLRQINDSAGGE